MSENSSSSKGPKDFSLDDFKSSLEKVSTNEVNLGPAKLTKETFVEVVNKLANSLGIAPAVVAKGIYYLFLKGAANKSTPASLFVEVKALDTTMRKLSKGDVLYFYKDVTQNDHLRRLAESVATEISTFAENKDLEGDLARQINRRLIIQESQSEEKDKGKYKKLTPKEAAWCSSFNQDNTDLESRKDLERVRALLTLDLEIKFSKPSAPKAKKKTAAKADKKKKDPKKDQSKDKPEKENEKDQN